MALFPISRYGTNEEFVTEDQSKILLKQLKENVARKKQEKLTGLSVKTPKLNEGDVSTLKRKISELDLSETSKIKKSKKNKNVHDTDSAECNSTDWQIVKKHKKKKVTKKDTDIEADETFVKTKHKKESEINISVQDKNGTVCDIGSPDNDPKNTEKSVKKKHKKKQKSDSKTESSELVEDDLLHSGEKKFKKTKTAKNREDRHSDKIKKTKDKQFEDVSEFDHGPKSKSKTTENDKISVEKVNNKSKDGNVSTVSKTKSKKKNEEDSYSDMETGEEAAIAKDSKQSKIDYSVKEGPHVFGNFTVLGEYKEKAKAKVNYMLPEWLSNPVVIKNDLEQTPIEEIDILNPRLIQTLHQNNFTHFFPVQTTLIPLILNENLNHLYTKTGLQPEDICVSAPTGSGKTLAYVLPIVQLFLPRVVCRIRALVLLPVRDLALQVFKVFNTYCQDTDLKVVLVSGYSTFEEEQKALVVKRMRGNCSLADIVVATPGRLVDHINNTPGFDLSHLRFLVIDEADRMVENIKQDWLEIVESKVLIEHPLPDGDTLDRRRLPTISSLQKVKLAYQKLLFSATLSQDPEILQELNLFQPRLFTTAGPKQKQKQIEKKSTKKSEIESKIESEEEEVNGVGNSQENIIGQYSTPPSLKELHMECKADEKPLCILNCLHNLNYRHVLCFTNSIESTHRLYLLVKLYGGIEVREFSSSLSATARENILNDLSSGAVDMIICSDAMARGIDVDNIEYVILYDRPRHIQTYIHRVGRTARAGKQGTSLAILEKREVCTFKTMLKEAGKIKHKKLRIKPNKFYSIKPQYNEALRKLPYVIKAEKRR